MQLYDEEKEIRAIVLEDSSYNVDWDNITHIYCYREAGEMGYIPWFDIYKENKLYKKINGKYVVTVVYKQD